MKRNPRIQALSLDIWWRDQYGSLEPQQDQQDQQRQFLTSLHYDESGLVLHAPQIRARSTNSAAVNILQNW